MFSELSIFVEKGNESEHICSCGYLYENKFLVFVFLYNFAAPCSLPTVAWSRFHKLPLLVFTRKTKPRHVFKQDSLDCFQISAFSLWNLISVT